MNFKILGRDPAALLGVVNAFLAILLSFGLFGLDQEHVAIITATVAAAFGLVAAYATKDSLLAATVGFAKAALILGAAYGLKVSDSQTASLIAAITIVGGFYLRSQTSSTNTAISSASRGFASLVGPQGAKGEPGFPGVQGIRGEDGRVDRSHS